MHHSLPFEAIAAFRFMRNGLLQTLLIIIGVAVGVIVFMSALLSGLQSNIFQRTFYSVTQIVISPPQETAELIALPLAERLRAMEALWDSLCRGSSSDAPVPGWHAQVLSARAKALDAGKTAVRSTPD